MDDDRKLWDLLGRSPRTGAPPFFAGKVMRQITAGSPERPSPFLPILRWLAPAAVTALVVFAVLPRHEIPSDTGELTALDLVEMVSPEDYDMLTSAGWPYDNGFLSASL